MVISTCDGFANYIIAQATTGSNFGDRLAQGLGLVTQAVGSGTLQPQGGFLLGLAGTAASAMLAIVIGAIALVASFVEFVLMAFRGGVLVILCGLIPLAAAFSNVPTGERWLRRIAGWIVALALYKLAAAFCYAAAFRLSAGTDVIAVMDGLALLVVSVLALPVLLRLTLPAAEQFALHRGAAATTRTAIGAMPTGAITLAAAAGGGGGGAMMATGAGEQGLTRSAGRGGGPGGAPSGAGPVGGGNSRPAGASGDRGAGASAAGSPAPRSSGTSGDRAKGSDSSSNGPGRAASPIEGEGSRGRSIPGATSTSFAVPGSGGSPDRDAASGGGGSAMPSGSPDGGAPPSAGVDGSRVDFGVPGVVPPGGSDIPRYAQGGPIGPPDSRSGGDLTGTDESWSGD
jgi:hypothetical protein